MGLASNALARLAARIRPTWGHEHAVMASAPAAGELDHSVVVNDGIKQKLETGVPMLIVVDLSRKATAAANLHLGGG